MQINVNIIVPDGDLCKNSENFECGYIKDYFCLIFKIGLWKTGDKKQFHDSEQIFKCSQCLETDYEYIKGNG